MFHMPQSKQPNRTPDRDQLAKLISDIATGEASERLLLDDGRDLAAVMMGRLGGLKGGHARARALTPARRSEIAQKAAEARWGARIK